MIFLYYLFYRMGFNSPEIPPYQLRAKGITIILFLMELMLVYNSFVNPIAMDAIDWKYHIVLCCLIAELVALYFAFSETKGHTLETVAKRFGDDGIHNVNEKVL